MIAHHAFGIPGAAGCVDQAGQVQVDVFAWGGVQRGSRPGCRQMPQLQPIDEGSRVLRLAAAGDRICDGRAGRQQIRQHIRPAGFDQQRLGAAVVEDVDQLVVLGGVVDDDENAARFERCEDAHHRLDRVLQVDGHPVAALHSLCAAVPGRGG